MVQSTIFLKNIYSGVEKAKGVPGIQTSFSKAHYQMKSSIICLVYSLYIGLWGLCGLKSYI